MLQREHHTDQTPAVPGGGIPPASGAGGLAQTRQGIDASIAAGIAAADRALSTNSEEYLKSAVQRSAQ